MSDATRKRRRRWLLKSLVALAIAVLCAVSLWHWFRGVREEWLATATPTALTAAAAQHPNDAELLYSLAYKLVQFGKYDQAAERMERLVQIEPTSTRNWLGLARAAGGAGQTVRAAEAYTKASALEPRSASPRYSLAQMYAEAGLASEALKLYEEAARLGPPTVISEESRARCLSRTGRESEAWEILQRVINAAPMQDSAYLLAGELSRRLRLFDEGEKLLRYRIGLTRGYPIGVARAPLARLLVAKSRDPGTLREAEQFARVAVKDPAPQPAFHAALADVLIAKGDLDGACKALEAVTRPPEPDPECVGLLARAYERLGRLNDAAAVRARLDIPGLPPGTLEALRARAAARPEDVAGRLELAAALRRGRRPAEAAEECHAILSREPGNQAALGLLNDCRIEALAALGTKRTRGPALDPNL